MTQRTNTLQVLSFDWVYSRELERSAIVSDIVDSFKKTSHYIE